MSGQAWAALAVFAVAYVLIATERVHRLTAVLGGAAVMLVIGATDAGHAFFDQHAGVDWSVLVLLVGMMLIVGVLRRTGLFEFLAIQAVKRAHGRPYPVLAMLVVVTAVASAGLDNVTTVLLIAPVTLLVCERLGLPAAPFLIAEVIASNIGGTATLIGDPGPARSRCHRRPKPSNGRRRWRGRVRATRSRSWWPAADPRRVKECRRRVAEQVALGVDGP